MNVKTENVFESFQLKISLCRPSPQSDRYFAALRVASAAIYVMFTIALSLNASYRTCQFRQVGGYAHGALRIFPEYKWNASLPTQR